MVVVYEIIPIIHKISLFELEYSIALQHVLQFHKFLFNKQNFIFHFHSWFHKKNNFYFKEEAYKQQKRRRNKILRWNKKHSFPLSVSLMASLKEKYIIWHIFFSFSEAIKETLRGKLCFLFHLRILFRLLFCCLYASSLK